MLHSNKSSLVDFAIFRHGLIKNRVFKFVVSKYWNFRIILGPGGAQGGAEGMGPGGA